MRQTFLWEMAEKYLQGLENRMYRLDEERKKLNYLVDYYEGLEELDTVSVSDGGSGGTWLRGQSKDSLCDKLLDLNDEIASAHELYKRQCRLVGIPLR
jgi:hypothetical protein